MFYKWICNTGIWKSTWLRHPYHVTLIASIIIGVFLSMVLHDYAHVSDSISFQRKIHHADVYNNWLHSHNISRRTLVDGILKSDSNITITESAYLMKKVRILCFVLLQSKVSSKFSFWSRTQSAKSIEIDIYDITETWGKRCTKLVFFTSTFQTHVSGATILPIKTRRNADSWSALRESLVQISNNYLIYYDWFLTVERNSFVILENLRYYLSVFNPSQFHYMGQISDSWLYGAYNTYTAGIVLSSGSLRKLHNSFIQGHCEESSSSGDQELGRCLSDLGIYPVDTRDHDDRSTFLPYDPQTHLIPGKRSLAFWESHGRHRLIEGPGCCSDYAITFNNIDSSLKHVMEYLVNHLKPTYKLKNSPTSSFAFNAK